MISDEVREVFLSFFEQKGHRVIPSSSLVPHKDTTLLLTTAGMVQIKPYFLGLQKPPRPRLASCQKCFRTTDIDSVGDSKHLTLFEMLGNFSVGDYFKEEAISWAWEFVIEYLKLPGERLWISIYLDDDEAFDYWRQVGVPAERILRFGEEDNFWGPTGGSGPCGPCSEIHYDHGEEFGCGRPECKPNCECGRFSEIWNLVFTQYNQTADGKRIPLPKPNIDTGMGLERTVAAVQGKPSCYETDLFLPLIERVTQLAGKSYGEYKDIDRAIRIVVEHSRGIAFLIADGVLPSNEGRGYVLRRILRRASLFGRRLGLRRPFLSEITTAAITRMNHVYPELMLNQAMIEQITTAEEEKFISTLETGLTLVEELIEETVRHGEGFLPSGQVFRLYDTYGFPAELTAEIASERGLAIDLAGFEAEMKKQQERARAKQRFDITVTPPPAEVIVTTGRPKVVISTEFIGYETTACRAKIVKIIVEEQDVDSTSKGSEADIILDKTPFYGEMGGQVGDTGRISSQKGEVAITSTARSLSDVIIHRGKVIEGSISRGDEVEAEVDIARRLDIARNHTATHLLQYALREILGSHVYQRGSLVEPDGFRFDFSHLAAIPESRLTEIQGLVNERIRQNLPVKSKLVLYDKAKAEGAIALFEEKYGETVRVVEIGEPALSGELCGGTHVKSTGEIGFFIIISEASIGTGLHRIEAVTGRRAEAVAERNSATLKSMAGELKTVPDEVHSKIRVLVNELESEHKHSLWLERELSRKIAESLIEQVKQAGGVTFLSARVPPLTKSVLREMGDILRSKLNSAVIVLATVYNDNPSFLAMVTPDLVARGFHANDIIKKVAKVAGGSGGGKAEMAQAGGKDATRLDEALNSVESIIAERLSSPLTGED
ncbi:MAG: alanine--tRNA ligase [Dehalococcoidia bacterium]|nr:alanine--tRNA ligase [Dehalococcoidia bacterium]